MVVETRAGRICRVPYLFSSVAVNYPNAVQPKGTNEKSINGLPTALISAIGYRIGGQGGVANDGVAERLTEEASSLPTNCNLWASGSL